MSQQAALKIYNKTWTPVAALQERFYLLKILGALFNQFTR